jgi:drug/metabolite transporter (DMT)-like permease
LSNRLLYLISVLIWGSTWFAIEFQLGSVAPEVSVAYRYVIAAALLFAWCLVRGLGLRYGIADHARFAAMGLLMFGLNYVFAYRAQVHITSALAAITFSTMLWMNIINARIFFGVRAGWSVLIGAALGIAGIIVLFAPQVGEISLDDKILVGCLLAALGALSASFGNMVSQSAQHKGLPVVQSNAWGMLYGALLIGAWSWVTGLEFSFDWSLPYVLSLLYLSLFGSVIAFWAYLTLLGRIGAHKAGYVTVMFPVVALLLSMQFEGLALDMSIVAGTALVLLGNVLVLRETGNAQEEIL